jgi:hypothetical protein
VVSLVTVSVAETTKQLFELGAQSSDLAFGGQSVVIASISTASEAKIVTRSIFMSHLSVDWALRVTIKPISFPKTV